MNAPWLVRDFVFPIVRLPEPPDTEGGFKECGFLGTGFLIGGRGFALTASHVIPSGVQVLCGLFVSDKNRWVAFPFESMESYGSEDVCLLKLPKGRAWKSPFRLRRQWEGASADYQMWGYPGDILLEQITNWTSASPPPGRPDMVFTKGYIRRWISHDLGIRSINGQSFFELSEAAGKGCSGAPVYMQTAERAWDVLGIYVAERLNVDAGISVAFAVRVYAFQKWVPSVLGRTVQEESDEYTP